MSSLIGRTVSHYRILELVGRGGTGAVHRAHDLELDRDVALKFISPDETWSDSEAGTEACDRFLREARAASALDHPHIATIYGIDRTEDGDVFIAMAYYDGETLVSRVRPGGLPVTDAVALRRGTRSGSGWCDRLPNSTRSSRRRRCRRDRPVRSWPAAASHSDPH